VARLEETVMIFPPPRASIGPTAARVHRNVPVRLVAMVRSQSARLSRAILPSPLTPALQTTTSSPPNSFTARSISARTESSSVTSAGW
jgi:hypothetical protein